MKRIEQIAERIAAAAIVFTIGYFAGHLIVAFVSGRIQEVVR